MQRSFFTIGFTGKTAEEFFALLREAGVKTVIDVRQNRAGQLSAFAKHPDLQYFLQETSGIAYRHEPLLAPTPEIRKKYQNEKNWEAYEVSFLALMRERGVPESVDISGWPDRVAFLCTEAGPEKCHRRLVAEVFAEFLRNQGEEVEIQHLVADRGKNAKTPIQTGFSATIPDSATRHGAEKMPAVVVTGWAATLGARRLAAEDVDRAFGMPLGKLRERAGIESLSYATIEQDEVSMADEALRQALQVAACPPAELDWIFATSETHREYPALAARLHKSLGAREGCGALDVGGACLGLLNALGCAQSFIESRAAQTIAIVTADVHSRTLLPRRVAGEFGGLFGDGASAFILRAPASVPQGAPLAGKYVLGKFIFGCANQYSEAICVADTKDGGLAVHFDGEALSRAAITRMERVIRAIESQSAIPVGEVGAFATHQPNPRLLTLLAKQCGVGPDSFPAVARNSGNLGSSTCGVALHLALAAASKAEVETRKAIFLASLGPGLIFGGGWLEPLKL